MFGCKTQVHEGVNNGIRIANGGKHGTWCNHREKSKAIGEWFFPTNLPARATGMKQSRTIYSHTMKRTHQEVSQHLGKERGIGVQSENWNVVISKRGGEKKAATSKKRHVAAHARTPQSLLKGYLMCVHCGKFSCSSYNTALERCEYMNNWFHPLSFHARVWKKHLLFASPKWKLGLVFCVNSRILGGSLLLGIDTLKREKVMKKTTLKVWSPYFE